MGTGRRTWPRARSPSSRRAWIEIERRRRGRGGRGVALLAEGVDRNLDAKDDPQRLKVSPSSRRAWIEIVASKHSILMIWVALLAEGVDRNLEVPLGELVLRRRPPRGGRG